VEATVVQPGVSGVVVVVEGGNDVVVVVDRATVVVVWDAADDGPALQTMRAAHELSAIASPAILKLSGNRL
jgi:hypothetical protein